jgi:hypothetical protein
MKRLLALSLSSFAVGISVASPAAGDPTGPCPDGFFPVYAPGDHHDKNGNAFVCRKLQDGRFSGGPDDSIDDIV